MTEEVPNIALKMDWQWIKMASKMSLKQLYISCPWKKVYLLHQLSCHKSWYVYLVRAFLKYTFFHGEYFWELVYHFNSFGVSNYNKVCKKPRFSSQNTESYLFPLAHGQLQLLSNVWNGMIPCLEYKSQLLYIICTHSIHRASIKRKLVNFLKVGKSSNQVSKLK